MYIKKFNYIHWKYIMYITKYKVHSLQRNDININIMYLYFVNEHEVF